MSSAGDALVAEIGAMARASRRRAGLTQDRLAEIAGTTRQWIIRLEAGDPTVRIGKVLDLLEVLGLEIAASADCG